MSDRGRAEGSIYAPHASWYRCCSGPPGQAAGVSGWLHRKRLTQAPSWVVGASAWEDQPCSRAALRAQGSAVCSRGSRTRRLFPDTLSRLLITVGSESDWASQILNEQVSSQQKPAQRVNVPATIRQAFVSKTLFFFPLTQSSSSPPRYPEKRKIAVMSAMLARRSGFASRTAAPVARKSRASVVRVQVRRNASLCSALRLCHFGAVHAGV